MRRYKKIDHVVMTVSNLNKSANFYEQLGFALVKGENKFELFAGDFKINMHLKNKEFDPRAKNIKLGSLDLCLELNGSLNEFRNELLQKGLKLELDITPKKGARGPMNSIYLRDLEGNLLEFCSYD